MTATEWTLAILIAVFVVVVVLHLFMDPFGEDWDE